MATQHITGNDNIQETVMKYPETIDVFMMHGLHCVGCHISESESINEGAYGHGMGEHDIASLIEDLNEAINDNHTCFDLKITQRAIEKINELMQDEEKSGHDLRITVVKEHGSFSYDFDFELKSKKDTDKIFEFFGLRVLVAPQSFALLKGTKIDYISNDFEEGFRIQNPQDSVSLPSKDTSLGCGC